MILFAWIKLFIQRNVISINENAMTEELLLEQKFGKRRPFKIPEGYFECVQDDVICKVVHMGNTRKRNIGRFMRLAAWAACAAAVIAVGILCLGKSGVDGGSMSGTEFGGVMISANTDYIMDEMSDYAMFDNDDYYSFIADE